MNAIERLYRTRDGVGLYRFRLEHISGRWHAVILSQPAYGARPTGLVQTHRLQRPDSSHIVCWDPLPTDARTAQDVARLWAECTQTYLATGRFGDPSTPRPALDTPRQPGDVDYHTLDGTAVYRFRIAPFGGVWRIHIVAQPAYAGRHTDANSTHRLGLGTANPYICWTPEPTSQAHAKEVARLWAEGTQRYIAAGRFPPPGDIPQPVGAGFHAPRPQSRLGLRDRLLRHLG